MLNNSKKDNKKLLDSSEECISSEDYDSNCSSDSDSEGCNNKSYDVDNNTNSQKNVDYISTEGIDSEIIEYSSKYIQSNLKQCVFCNKYFKNDMIVPNKDNIIDEFQCWHCLFWMNYSIPNRKNVDGTFGMTIVEYILKCKDDHETTLCKKNSDTGGCFLCEYKLDFPITDIKDLFKLNKSVEIQDNPINDFDVDDNYNIYDCVYITVEI